MTSRNRGLEIVPLVGLLVALPNDFFLKKRVYTEFYIFLQVLFNV